MGKSQDKNNVKKTRKEMKIVTSEHEETMTESKRINDGCQS
jgi:hypothetical protein